MATRKSTVADRAETPPDGAADAATAQIATIVSVDDGVPVLDIGDGPTVAGRLAIAATAARLDAAIRERHPVVVLFEHGDRRRPIVVGFLETRPRAARPAPRKAAGKPMPFVDVDADGRRLRVTAQDEIVLQCGKASITLRRNGRVILRGTYVESHSDGTNRIKGGQVQIN